MSGIQALADIINGMSPGQWLDIDRHQLADLPFNYLAYHSPDEHIRELVIGSAHADLWDFSFDPHNGNFRVKRLAQ